MRGGVSIYVNGGYDKNLSLHGSKNGNNEPKCKEGEPIKSMKYV